MTRMFDIAATQPAPRKHLERQGTCARFSDSGLSARPVESSRIYLAGNLIWNPESGAAMS